MVLIHTPDVSIYCSLTATASPSACVKKKKVAKLNYNNYTNNALFRHSSFPRFIVFAGPHPSHSGDNEKVGVFLSYLISLPYVRPGKPYETLTLWHKYRIRILKACSLEPPDKAFTVPPESSCLDIQLDSLFDPEILTVMR